MLHRRDAMLRLGRVGLGSLTLPALLGAEQGAAAENVARPGVRASGRRGTAKSCILIYLWGGPPQQDMWDMKPLASSGIRSQFEPIATVVPGIDVCDQMPLFAQHTDKVAIVRALTHDSNVHEPSVYRTLTGRTDPTMVIPRNKRSRQNFPTLGSVVSSFSPLGPLPATVTIPRPIGHDGVTYAGTHAGFLGARYDPMELQQAGETRETPTHSMALPAELSERRLLARRGLLQTIEDVDRRYEQYRAVKGLDSFRDQAFSILASPLAKRAFDLDREDPRTRDRYGRNEYGESILLARRLVESGVRLVTISWMYIQKSGNVANVWDNHGPFEGLTGFGMLKAPYCLPSLDQGFSALMEDLSARGELDETLVAMFGEFGRTPKINKSAGRDHWGACQSAVLAGGGIRGGQVYGSSDADAAFPKSNPVSPEDMLATIYHGLGISPEAEMHDALGRPHRLVDGKPIEALFV